MRVISLLRSAVAGPRQRPIGALAILTMIIGVVTMHSMIGTPTSHSHSAPHDVSVVATDQGATAPAVVPATTTDGHPAGEHGAGACEGCCGDGLATAMCLMILVAILALFVPARRLLWRAPLKLAMSLTPALAAVRAFAAPSLHELCISRT